MEIAALVFIIIFGIISILELIFCIQGKKKLRKIIKTFCVLTLSLAVILVLPNHPLLYCALICGFLGDLLLIFKKNICFYFGAFFFFAGHILFYSEICLNLLGELVPYYFYIIFALTYVLLALILYKPLQKFSKKPAELIAGSIYFSTLIHAIVLMTVATCYHPTSFMYFGIFGYILFLTSDFLLVYTRFIKTFKRRDFAVMSTYLFAELFISLSFYLTYLFI